MGSIYTKIKRFIAKHKKIVVLKNYFQSKWFNFKKNVAFIIMKKIHFNIQVMNIEETINKILEEKKSIIRLGDGEFQIIEGGSISYYQEYNPKLANSLKSVLFEPESHNALICLPDTFSDLNKYTKEAQRFFLYRHLVDRKILHKIEKINYKFGSAFISRPYLDLKNKSESVKYFNLLKQIWFNKDILIVEGEYSHSGEGNDLFSKALSVKRIICPAKNAFDKKREIEEAIIKNCKGKIVLLVLGPTAKVIVNDLDYLPEQLIDLGHIDSEYEWFKMKATQRVKIKNKHTAEFADSDIEEAVKDPAFKNEIVAKIV